MLVRKNMSQANPPRATELTWTEQVKYPFKGLVRDPHYKRPGYVKYRLTCNLPGFDRPVLLSIEMPLQRSIDVDIDEERLLLPKTASSEFEREDAAFEQMLPELLASKSGRFVALLHGQIIDEDADEFALATRIQASYRGVFVLIRQVTRHRVTKRYFESPERAAP
jgi:hypothetical protein